MANRVILRQAEDWLSFETPHSIVATTRVEDVLPSLREIEKLVNKNAWHAVGFLSYEASPAFDSALRVRSSARLPLLWFGLYPEPLRSALPKPASSYSLTEWMPDVSRDTYNAAIEQVMDHIAHGNTYQVNYTFRLKSRFSGDPFALFLDMIEAQPVGYPACIETDDFAICSASPELFFMLEDNTVTCRPMKGTVKRGRTLSEDETQSAWLQRSVKNRAENVMIVDMIRNDLGRLAEIGSMRVPQLFSTERYRTLWQMTSTVTAEIHAPFSDLMTALFPCASITGAPKISTMGIIADLEASPRGVYTGCIGYLAPGGKAQFNVAIRTATIFPKHGEAEYGVGGGIVWDSTAADEYTEALLKAQVLTRKHPSFDLLDTLRWTPEDGYYLLERHLLRLRDSSIYFGFPFDSENIRTELARLAGTFPCSTQRVRLLLHLDGQLTLQTASTPAASMEPLQACLASEPTQTSDIFLYHKTTYRIMFEKARTAHPGFEDVLLFNEHGELTEFTIGNLVVELNGQFVTPPVACGLLPGTLRAELLETGVIHERILPRASLPKISKVFRVNSVRGWQKMVL